MPPHACLGLQRSLKSLLRSLDRDPTGEFLLFISAPVPHTTSWYLEPENLEVPDARAGQLQKGFWRRPGVPQGPRDAAWLFAVVGRPRLADGTIED